MLRMVGFGQCSLPLVSFHLLASQQSRHGRSWKQMRLGKQSKRARGTCFVPRASPARCWPLAYFLCFQAGAHLDGAIGIHGAGTFDDVLDLAFLIH